MSFLSEMDVQLSKRTFWFHLDLGIIKLHSLKKGLEYNFH